MIFGQDESVFNQFLWKARQWVSPDGQRALLPKTDGLRLMLSALQARETGFGVHISRMKMEEINETRWGRNYADMDAAIAIHGQVAKKNLEESPLVVSFELGTNNEGYWTYSHILRGLQQGTIPAVQPHVSIQPFTGTCEEAGGWFGCLQHDPWLWRSTIDNA
jgi:hypothetical protein